MPKSNSFFSKKLILWYLAHKRDLPWRSTSNPYYIWLSEIILQQTRVEQGLPYYQAFISAFPTVKDLANAKEEEVLKLWQGLGYYSRARNLYASANYIYYELNEVFPDNYKDLLKLKGVGDYTASAIASICYNKPTAVVDGNVYRVLSRYFGIATPINTSIGIKEFKRLAQDLIDIRSPGTHNQALMEFGARQCKPQNPDCLKCVLNESCYALQNKKITSLPVKLKKTIIKKVYFNYLLILTNDNKTIIKKREDKGIWQNLYDFPLVESDKFLKPSSFFKSAKYIELKNKYNLKSAVLFNDTPIIHKLSHRHIYTNFWIVESATNFIEAVSINKLVEFPVPKLISNFIDVFFKNKESIQKQKK